MSDLEVIAAANFGKAFTLERECARLRGINAELLAALEELLEALRVNAPGTPLNNHRFDALGIKAYAVIAKAKSA